MSHRPLALGWSVLAALAIGGGDEVAGQEITGDLERFELFTECAPMSVHVTVWGDRGYGPREVELEERGQTMAEGRLRLARLLDSSYNISGPFLGVEVGRAGLRMMLFKTVHDHASGVEQYAVTWQRGLGWVDAQGADAVADARFILQGLSDDLDHFIGDYLRVNGEYCQ